MLPHNTTLGLKIDVDTFRGTQEGVPRLLKALGDRTLCASFFLSIGPDNMGRHVWRLIKPKFLLKMLRGNAAKLYGWDILLKGTFWPGPEIAGNLKNILRSITDHGHEIALHALDHHRWQTRINSMNIFEAKAQLDIAAKKWNSLFGSLPAVSGTPGWQLSDPWLEVEDGGGWVYHSDCRGSVAGRIRLNGKVFEVPQIPTTLPTFDEVIGSDGVTVENYNDKLIALLRPGELNVLTIHAEAEGGVYHGMFERFLDACLSAQIAIVPLKHVHDQALSANGGHWPVLDLKFKEIPGREGKVAVIE